MTDPNETEVELPDGYLEALIYNLACKPGIADLLEEAEIMTGLRPEPEAA